MPEKFLKFLQLVKDQLFYNADYIVLFDEHEWTKKGFSDLEITQSINYLLDRKLASKMQSYQVFKDAGLPSTTAGRKGMVNHSFRYFLRTVFVRDAYKLQIALQIEKAFDDFYAEHLGQPNNGVPVLSVKSELNFDPKESVLNLNGEKIRIQQKNDKPNAHYVLEHIFENPDGLTAENFYSEIISSKFNSNLNDDDKDNWRKCYRACEDIQAKVMKQTKARIEDFLVFRTGVTGSVKINPKFIPK